MNKLRQATDIIARVERGDLNHDLSNEIQKVLKELQDVAPPKGKAKGQVKLTLDFAVSSNTVEISASIDAKVPKRPRGSTTYWVTTEGEVSTEHPQQDDMFKGPREVREHA